MMLLWASFWVREASFSNGLDLVAVDRVRRGHLLEGEHLLPGVGDAPDRADAAFLDPLLDQVALDRIADHDAPIIGKIRGRTFC
jgi:hypothetical protein